MSRRPKVLADWLRERLVHNRDYLACSKVARLMAAELSYGETKSDDWLAGEEAAIRAENEWIEAALEDGK